MLTVSAQDVDMQDTLNIEPEVQAEPIVTPQLRGAREATDAEKEYARMLAEEREQQQIDQTLPPVDENGQVIAYTDRFNPYLGLSWVPSWDLHKGLNVNIGTSVFANFGGHGYHGAGFTQDISLMYVTNLSKKATLAVGGYLNNMTFHGDNYTTAGVTAVLGYQFDEHWSAYAFVQKAFNSGNYARIGGYYPYGYGYYGYYDYPYGYPMGRGYGNGYAARNMDRIGAGLRYEWGNHNYVQIQFEFDHAPNPHHNYYDNRRYDYPVR